MYNQTELYDLSEKNEAEFFLDLAKISTKRSEWTLTSGIPSNVFIDIDEVILYPEKADELIKKVCVMINLLLEQGFIFNKIGFIEKKDGTVGLISLLSSILVNVRMPGIIIRPKKKLIQDQIKGQISKGDKILIISDLATSGITVYSAAEIIYAYGGVVPYSLVIIDRVQGATENLGRKGIRLFSLVSLKSLNKHISNKENRYKINKPIFQDFGGRSITIAG